MLRKSTFVLASLPAAIAATAATNSISQVNNSVRAAFVYQYMYYRETSTKQGHEVVDDTNRGNMPGFALEANHEFGHIYTDVAMKALNGNTPYKGATVGTNIPVSNDNAPSFIFDMTGIAGYRFNFGSRFALTPYGEIGYHSWERSSLSSVTSQGGSVEGGQGDYSNNYWAGGLRAQFQVAQSLVLTAFGAAGRTFNAHVYNTKTKLYPSSDIHAGTTYSLKSKPWYNAGLGLDWAVAGNFHLFTTLEYTRFKYGKSNIENTEPNNPHDGSDEPDSFTRYFATYLGLAYSFNTNQKGSKTTSAENSLAAFNNEGGAEIMGMYTNYRLAPKAGSAAKDIRTGTHSGTIPGLRIFLSHSFGHFVFQASGDYASEHVHFKSNDPSTPYSTNDAKINHYNGGIALGYLHSFSDKSALLPKVVLGFEHDNFIIQKTSYNIPESNVYYFFYTGLGLDYQQQLSDGWIMSPSIEGGATVANTVYAPLAEVQFHNSPAPWYGAGLKFDYAINQDTHFVTNLDYRYVAFKQSDLTQGNTPSTEATMPKAHLSTVSLSAGIAFNT
ncbi:MAG: hypothetical protein COV52_02980 [Gammaproteobacteria bacterium CG11_big_fil_rev_8_21_14_0_20_46_22]|nr:MAG: hypothetical protein COW05_02080 [Gammaproteobacteria bacterium CG12_big_fil_rev_8_21_14_0_65_46_12]PIR11739.1 MAG: hypothetical protein COV52_02980 [Gammaproteobacteria bacterium CG11_big_fil_rev_8_21_14_0_20_46_22]